VLATVLEAAERSQAGDEQDTVIDDPLSPVSSMSGGGALAPKFDGAHLFAGHEGAVVPARQQPRSAQRKEVEELQARLDASEARAQRREAELAEAEAELEDSRTAADARAALESKLELEHASLEQERKRTAELESRLAFLELEVESSSARGGNTVVRLEGRVRALERELEDVVAEAQRVRTEAEAKAEAWAEERARYEQEETQLVDGIENERARWEHDREELAAQAKDQIAVAADGLRALVQQFDVPLFSRESGLGVLVDALRRHLEKQTQSAQDADLLLAAEVEKRATISNELETAKVEIQVLQARSSSVSVTVSLSAATSSKTNALLSPHAE
jgi:chromosome segregation ATPase